MLQKTIAQNGFDGWMEDFGEGAWTKDARFKMAGKNAELAILYPLLYHRAANEAVDTVTRDSQRAGDIVRFARSGAPGSQAFTPMVWGGDQIPEWSADHGIPSVIPAGTSIGLCGFTLWAPDIVSWGTSKEMWIRWMEYGALTPVMRDHLAQKPQKAVDLWYDAQTTDLFRRYARLHISLFPYFYTYAHEAAETGWPLIRHLILDSPEDPQAWDADQEYLLGGNILVAPVTDQGATARSLYLPKGTWVDYWTGKTLNGGRQVRVDAPLDRIPILIRAGSVIP
jgi:alpha-D-xyloside xylohydrolase/alpha-glucosidase